VLAVHVARSDAIYATRLTPRRCAGGGKDQPRKAQPAGMGGRRTVEHDPAARLAGAQVKDAYGDTGGLVVEVVLVGNEREEPPGAAKRRQRALST
jgi:hypothetical protein